MIEPSRPSHWRKTSALDRHKVEAFLMEREKFCVAACARFLHVKKNNGHVWYLNEQPGQTANPKDKITALLLHSDRALFPVFNNLRIPGPRFFSRFLGKIKIHAIQGLRPDAELLETLMEGQGYFAADRIDYHLMSLDCVPKSEAFNNPDGLILRKPKPENEDDLFALQAAYDQEEVIPKNAKFNPVLCRLNLSRILSSEQILVAELDGQVVGKINTSAESFTRYQIGGVYVRPDCRGLGIGTRMIKVFSESLLAQGKGVTLFVKKHNAAATKIYRKAGFSILAEYRISYY